MQRGKVVNPSVVRGFSAAVIPYLNALGLKAEGERRTDRLISDVAIRSRDSTGSDGACTTTRTSRCLPPGWSEQRFRFEEDGRLKLKWK